MANQRVASYGTSSGLTVFSYVATVKGCLLCTLFSFDDTIDEVLCLTNRLYDTALLLDFTAPQINKSIGLCALLIDLSVIMWAHAHVYICVCVI